MVFEAAGAWNVHVWKFVGLSCEAPATQSSGAAGVSHDCPRAQTCTHHRHQAPNRRRDGIKLSEVEVAKVKHPRSEGFSCSRGIQKGG